MTWFEELTGTGERSAEQVRSDLRVVDDSIVCANGRRIAFGSLETPRLDQLRSRCATSDDRRRRRLRVREVVADVRDLHADPSNANAVFQVASQCNLLEMASPHATPEDGVGIYEFDPTQGPACAIACGAGTIYRNYFAPVGKGLGQTASRQIDCAADLAMLLGSHDLPPWRMQNGYLLANREALECIAAKLRRAPEPDLDSYRQSLRIGIQRQTEVTWPTADGEAPAGHRVTQCYCSAVPVAYSDQPAELWAPLAQLVLEAAYEATLCTAVDNARATGMRRLFLTLLGGGAFGNPIEWIVAAMARALRRHQVVDLDVVIVSHGSSHPAAREIVELLAKPGPNPTPGPSSGPSPGPSQT